jgi:hypothetical protein
MQARALAALTAVARTAEEIAAALAEPDVETVHHLLQHLAANGRARSEGDGTAARFAAG